MRVCVSVNMQVGRENMSVSGTCAGVVCVCVCVCVHERARCVCVWPCV